MVFLSVIITLRTKNYAVFYFYPLFDAIILTFIAKSLTFITIEQVLIDILVEWLY